MRTGSCGRDGGWEFGKDGGEFGDLHFGFDGVVAVVEANAEDAGWRRDGSEEAGVIEQELRGVGFDRGIVKGFRARANKGDCVGKTQRAEVEDEIVSEQTGARFGVCDAEGDEFHRASLQMRPLG